MGFHNRVSTVLTKEKSALESYCHPCMPRQPVFFFFTWLLFSIVTVTHCSPLTHIHPIPAVALLPSLPSSLLFPRAFFTLRPVLYLDFLVFGAATTLPAANICKWFRGKRQYGKTSKLKKSNLALQYQRWTEGRRGQNLHDWSLTLVKGARPLASKYSQLNILCCSLVRWG